MNVEIKAQERIDELGRNGYRILQDPDRFCFGMDAVLLSDFAKVKRGAKVIDFCTLHFGGSYKPMDMWYGQVAYPWNFEPVTEWFFYEDPRTSNYEKDYDI